MVILLIFSCSNPSKEWENTEKLNTIEAYENFIKKHPSSDFTGKAKVKIEELKWQNAIDLNKVEEFKRYLANYPQGRFSVQAISAVETLHWQDAEIKNSVDGYEIFLKEHPNSQFANRARLAIEVKRSIVDKVPLCFVYEGAEVPILLEPSGGIIRIAFKEGDWRILQSDISDIEKIKSEKIFVNAIRAPNRIVKIMQGHVKCSENSNLSIEDEKELYFLKYIGKKFLLFVRIEKSKFDIVNSTLNYFEIYQGIRIGKGKFTTPVAEWTCDDGFQIDDLWKIINLKDMTRLDIEN